MVWLIAIISIALLVVFYKTLLPLGTMFRTICCSAVAWGFWMNAERPLQAAMIVADPPAFIHVVGPIEARDSENFRREIGAFKIGGVVNVESDGGDVKAAMEIGRLIRKSGFAVTVRDGRRCASSCIFLLAAGNTKIVGRDAKIIIHRPYLTSALPKGQDYDSHFKQMLEVIKRYFEEMNVPTELADRMISIPPHKGERLSRAELNRYMLEGDDPAYAQKEAVQDARQLKISLVELNRRKAAADVTCSWPWRDEPLPPIFEFLSYTNAKTTS